MEPRDRAPQELSPPARSATSRIRLAAAALLLVGLALVQDPGFLVPDTKFDLVEAPGAFLTRALHLWDAQGAFGQLQNQAYGYLWPMGPFFTVGDAVDLPGWLVQRLWLALVLVVAFLGAAAVVRALGVRSDLACLAAGFAFALSPRMLTVSGPISIEAWPSAVAPWVLLALVRGSRSGSARRWAALAGLAVGMVGGVNAAATFAVIPLGVVWLLTRSPGPRRRTLMLWWPLCTLAATLWWLVPLALMGSYSPPFLDFIETSGITTFPTDLWNVLRGTSDWVPYVDASSRAGNDLITTPYLVLNSGIVLAAGVAGLADRSTRERGFLALSVLVGVLMVSAGHSGVVEGFGSGEVRSLLDGVLSPLRNVHKFDVVLRLPLVVGLALVLDRAVAAWGRREPTVARTNQAAVVGLVLVAVAGSVVPAAAGRITPSGATLGVPAYWSQAESWLEAHQDDGSSLLAPGSGFADYVWGSPQDEPLQYLGDARWAVRNVIPLAPPGNIRMLDEVERRMAQGEGSAGFAAYLARAGVRYVVVRNDLQPSDDVPYPVVVHQVLTQSGLTRVASFGPEVGGGATLPEQSGTSRVVVNGGWQALYPAVEVFEVPGDATRAVAAGDPPVVVGGPEDLVDLSDLGLLGDAPVQLATDRTDTSTAAPSAPVVLTDGLRARERSFPRIHDGYSATLTPGDVRRTGNPARDYRIDDGDRWSTTVRLDGARAVSASSSLSDSTAPGGSQRGRLPYAALDGAASTEWVSAPFQDGAAWWQVDLDHSQSPGTVTVRGGSSAPLNQTLRLVTAQGRSAAVRVGPGQTARLEAPDGATGWLRVEDASGTPGRQVAIAEVRVEGLAVRRELATPVLPSGWSDPDAVVLRADRDARRGCVQVGSDVRCDASGARADEEGPRVDRVVTLGAAATWTPEVLARPLGGRSLDDLVQRGQGFRATASSRAVADPRGGAVAAVDGDPGTTWTASLDDLRPTLTMRWLGRSRIDSIDLSVDDGTAARLPTQVTLTWPGGTRQVDLEDGRADFPALRTDRLTLRVDAADGTQDLGFDATRRDVPIGIGEVRLGGLSYLPLQLSLDARQTACGTGPRVQVGATTYDTYVEASPVALMSATAVPAVLCDATTARPRADPVSSVSLGAGETVVSMRGSRAFSADSLVLRRTDGQLAGAGVRAGDVVRSVTESGDAVDRRLTPLAGASVLELRQNTNPGWEATQDGRRLTPVVLDGWKQGFVLAGGGAVSASFAPDGTYRLGLAAGLLTLIALAVALVATRRRGRSVAAALGPRGPAWWVSGIAVAAGAGLVAGWVGLVLAVATLAGLVVGRRVGGAQWGAIEPWVLGTGCFVVALWNALRPWGDPNGWAGQDAWTSYVLVVVVTGLLVTSAGSRTRFFNRRAGRSTSR